jgi:hypothetical protein
MILVFIVPLALLLRLTGRWWPTVLVLSVIALDITIDSALRSEPCPAIDYANAKLLDSYGIAKVYLEDDAALCDDECFKLIRLMNATSVQKTIKGQDYEFYKVDQPCDTIVENNSQGLVAPDVHWPMSLFAGGCIAIRGATPGEYQYRQIVHRSEKNFGAVTIVERTIQVRQGSIWRTVLVYGNKTMRDVMPITRALVDMDTSFCRYGRETKAVKPQ